jgi:hypothetical protein
VKCIAVLAVLAVFGLGAAPADTPTREEETLLLEVGRRVLRNESWKGIFDTAPRPTCVIYTNPRRPARDYRYRHGC